MATVHSLYEQITLAIDDGEYDRALSMIQAISQHFPDDFQTRLLMARIHLENGRLQDAEAGFEAVLDIDPENVLARSAMAIVAEEQGHLGRALEHFESAFNLDPSNEQVASEVRRLRSLLHKRNAGELGTSWHAQASRLLKEQEYGGAILAFHNAMRQKPEAVDVLIGTAQALWFSKRFREAEDLCDKVVARYPNCLKALAILAGTAIVRRDKSFNSFLNRTAALNPGNVVARGFIEGLSITYPRIGERVDVPITPYDRSGATRPSTSVGQSADETVVSDERPSDGAVATGADADGELSPAAGGEGEASPRSPDSGASPRQSEDADGSRSQTSGTPTDALPHGRPQVPVIIGPPDGVAIPAKLFKPMGAEVSIEHRANAQIHLSFGRTFEARGRPDMALDEYGTALCCDPATARAVADAVGAILTVQPTNPKARWLMGDALVLQGRFRQAAEQYMVVLRNGQAES